MYARLMGLKSISPRGLDQQMKSTPLVVIDVNPPHGWTKERVPGALNLDPVAFSSGDLPSNKDAMLVFYCSGFLCTKAPNAARRAKNMGYSNVHVMSAGISGWLSADLPTERGLPKAN